jgi:glycerol-3-phosphate acyltransferase PlsY
MRLLFNILAISGSAMFAGVMLAIGVMLGGYWKSLPASGFLDWFSQNNRFIMRVIPLVVVPAFLGLAGSLWLGWSDGKARALWTGAILCIVAVLGLTMTWFVPTNAQFATKSIPLDQVPARLDTWLMVHGIRIALATIGSVLSILAISR